MLKPYLLSNSAGAPPPLRFDTEQNAPTCQLILTAGTTNPLADLNLKLLVLGTPRESRLTLRSTPYSEIFYEQLLPLTAYSSLIEWQIPVVPNRTGFIYVACGLIISNILEFKKF
jgi:hypothetical protein